MAALDPELSATALPLAAAHFILSPARQKTENEIVGVSVLEALRSGQMGLVDVTDRCQQMWPGSGITLHQVEVALETAKSAGWVIDTQDEHHTHRVWGHTGATIPDLEEAHTWAQDVVSATKSQLRDASNDAGFSIPGDQLDLWFDIVWGAVCSGAAAGAQVFSGAVERLADGSLTPVVFDMEAARDHVVSCCAESDIQHFLSSMVESAVNNADVFGNDLVSAVCAGYLLHAFLANRDVPKARRDLGTLAGRRIVIDTPWLLAICGSRRSLAGFQSIMKAGRAAGLDIVVAAHTVEEVLEVVARAEEEISGIAAEIRDGLDPQILLASLQGNQNLVAVWLSHAIEADDFDWMSFQRQVEWVLSQAIPDCGIFVRPHGNVDDDEVARVERSNVELRAALLASERGRGTDQIRRDAHTMVLASRPRRLHGTAEDFWPMGWVVTVDRHMDTAYQQSVETAEPSLTLTPSQLVHLVAIGASAKREKDLAAAATDIFVREASLGIAVQWPPGMLLEIAKSLHPESGVTVTDVRLSHRSFDRLLEEQPDILNDPREAGARLVAMTVAERPAALRASAVTNSLVPLAGPRTRRPN